LRALGATGSFSRVLVIDAELSFACRTTATDGHEEVLNEKVQAISKRGSLYYAGWSRDGNNSRSAGHWPNLKNSTSAAPSSRVLEPKTSANPMQNLVDPTWQIFDNFWLSAWRLSSPFRYEES
jgi:hypothetical protein